MEKLVILAIIAIGSAISNWLKKRREAENERNTNTRTVQSPTPAAPRPARPTNWEEELRRLIETNQPPSPPPAAPRPVAPPVVRTPTGPAMVPPPVRPAVVTAPRRPSVPPPVRPVIVARPMSAPGPTPLPVPTVTAVGSRDLASMSESRAAYARGSDVATQADARIDQASTGHVGLTFVQRDARPPEVAQVLALFRNAKTARQAVLASVILNPPKALENTAAMF